MQKIKNTNDVLPVYTSSLDNNKYKVKKKGNIIMSSGYIDTG